MYSRDQRSHCNDPYERPAQIFPRRESNTGQPHSPIVSTTSSASAPTAPAAPAPIAATEVRKVARAYVDAQYNVGKLREARAVHERKVAQIEAHVAQNPKDADRSKPRLDEARTTLEKHFVEEDAAYDKAAELAAKLAELQRPAPAPAPPPPPPTGPAAPATDPRVKQVLDRLRDMERLQERVRDAEAEIGRLRKRDVPQSTVASPMMERKVNTVIDRVRELESLPSRMNNVLDRMDKMGHIEDRVLNVERDLQRLTSVPSSPRASSKAAEPLVPGRASAPAPAVAPVPAPAARALSAASTSSAPAIPPSSPTSAPDCPSTPSLSHTQKKSARTQEVLERLESLEIRLDEFGAAYETRLDEISEDFEFRAYGAAENALHDWKERRRQEKRAQSMEGLEQTGAAESFAPSGDSSASTNRTAPLAASEPARGPALASIPTGPAAAEASTFSLPSGDFVQITAQLSALENWRARYETELRNLQQTLSTLSQSIPSNTGATEEERKAMDTRFAAIEGRVERVWRASAALQEQAHAEDVGHIGSILDVVLEKVAEVHREARNAAQLADNVDRMLPIHARAFQQVEAEMNRLEEIVAGQGRSFKDFLALMSREQAQVSPLQRTPQSQHVQQPQAQQHAQQHAQPLQQQQAQQHMRGATAPAAPSVPLQQAAQPHHQTLHTHTPNGGIGGGSPQLMQGQYATSSELERMRYESFARIAAGSALTGSALRQQLQQQQQQQQQRQQQQQQHQGEGWIGGGGGV